MNVLEELEEAKAIYKGLQQMYSGEMVDGETVMEELKNNMDYKIYLTVGWNKNVVWDFDFFCGNSFGLSV